MARSRRTQGEGAVFEHTNKKDGSKRWRGYVARPDGGRRYVSGKTKLETVRKVAELRRRVEQGLPLPDDRLTVKAFLEDWLKRSERTLRPTSYRRYKQVVEDHIITAVGDKKLSRLLPDDLDDLYRKQLAAKLSPHTVGLTHAVIHAALERAYRWGKVARNVADLVSPPERPQEGVDTLDSSEVQSLIGAAQGDPLEPLFLLALTAGLRRGELLGLRWSRVDLDAGTLVVDTTLLPSKSEPVFGKPKTKSSERTVFLGPIMVAKLRAHKGAQREQMMAERLHWVDHDLVFPGASGRPFATSTLGTRWKELLKRAELRHVKFHSTRHASATAGKDANVAGKDMADRLGHSALAMTARYTHVDDTARRRVAQQMDDYLFGATSAS